MNKGELVDRIFESKEFESKAAAERALKAILESIEAGLKKDQKVQIVGFGTFAVKHYPARDGVKPGTREPMRIPARTAVGFKAGQDLKSKLS
ncbi:MAG: HU family DNA-binding protein [Planctomycetes bacterium]|nr:HU family DNA-binding protein [Planctomycetota bacterium]